jgi:DUF2075 family protein
MIDYSLTKLSEIASSDQKIYVSNATLSMQARFSNFIVTPEQIQAWAIGFAWLHALAIKLGLEAGGWIALPEYSAPLISGRPDLVLVTPKRIFVIEMKTGISEVETSGKKQVLKYSVELWGKLKAARNRQVIPVLLSYKGNANQDATPFSDDAGMRPSMVLNLQLEGLRQLLQHSLERGDGSELDFESARLELLYSPRPSIVEAATALMAATQDKNITTGLSEEGELDKIAKIIQSIGQTASEKSEHRIVVIAGPPGAGKTIVGLRLAHDEALQKILPVHTGTPLYLTGNGPLVDVLVESLARDESLRNGTTIELARSHANTKVRSIHGVTEKKLGIESNVIIFDEGQRIWNAKRMQDKKGDPSLGSEAEEVLSYLEGQPWALAVVLLGEGQEINTGEEGVVTWLQAVASRNALPQVNWRLTAPELGEKLTSLFSFETDPNLRLKVARRTDNAADVSLWVSYILDNKPVVAKELRNSFAQYPLYVTRDLEHAKSWIRLQTQKHGGSSGLLASSRSKRLFRYGIDVVSDANRSFNWPNWYLNGLPDINSSEALEIGATEYKCQGLELDWVGMIWSWDLVQGNTGWTPRRLDSARRRWNLSKGQAAIFQINAYRVLLTRSRKGMVICVPEGTDSDPSMLKFEMDSVAELLIMAGAEKLPSIN